MFDRIITSTDENPMFLQFLPIVSTAWKKYFPDIPLSVAFISNRNYEDPLVKKMQTYADIKIFNEIEGIPSANQAKISRPILASYYSDDVCMIEDMDTIPLQRTFFEDRTSTIKENEILIVGHEVYAGSEHEGKAPISTMSAKGNIFKEIINPNNLEYIDIMKSFLDVKVFDHKEAVNNRPSEFSDESLMRVLLDRWGGNINKVDRNVDIQSDWIDRTWWNINEEKLKNDGYITCNFLRPFEPNYERIEPIIKHIYNNKFDKNEIILEN